MSWISIRERMPPETEAGDFILLSDGKDVLCGGYIEGAGFYELDYGSVHGITHWMPKPDLPPSNIRPEATAIGDHQP